MKPILLIHGYSTEGDQKSGEKIYEDLPLDLSRMLDVEVTELNLSRWISLSNGVSLDDVSFAMDRALRSAKYRHLLQNGFHVVIHSTGALVVRNWLRKFSPKPSPIMNVVQLAGANFGSGLAHIGRVQIHRWFRNASGTEIGDKVLDELEFGSWKTLDLHQYFLNSGNHMLHDYEVQEFNLIGSQTTAALRFAPIRYLKEDSSDNTVRTSASNLNFKRVRIQPTAAAREKSGETARAQHENLSSGEEVSSTQYTYDIDGPDYTIPFAVVYETAHFGEDVGIVNGKKNRKRILPTVVNALKTEFDSDAYTKQVDAFRKLNDKTFRDVAKLKTSPLEWNKQRQYDGHAQLVFRIRDQNGIAVEDFDINFESMGRTKKSFKGSPVELMIEDDHVNKRDAGTITFYLRTQEFHNGQWREKLETSPELSIQITAEELASSHVSFLPVNIRLSNQEIRQMVASFQTTVFEVEMMRIPHKKVFEIGI